MNRTDSMTDKADRADPWSVPIVVAQIPDTGLHREFAASSNERQAIAELGGLRDVLSASASLDGCGASVNAI